MPMNWVLLRGLGRVKEHWLNFPELLATPDSQILCLDLPGLGQNKNIAAPLTIKETTMLLRKQFESLRGTQKNWGIIGISLGGMVTLQWLHDHPEDFQCGVVMNSSARDLASFPKRLSPFSIYCGARWASSKDPEKAERFILKMISNLKCKDPEILKAMTRIAISSQISAKTIARQGLAALRFMAPVDITPPLLILAALKDQMVDVKCSKMLAERYKATVKFHPTAGHDLTLDDPQWVADRIQEFATY